jgi:hypothetical protein
MAQGRWRESRHALDRMEEQDLTRPEVRYILETGLWEEDKDQPPKDSKGWSYAIRGFTVDRRELRVAVSIVEDKSLVVVTVIELNRID